MRDNRLDSGIVGIRRRVGASENIFVVEDIETLVLHCAHIEGAHRDDHENIEVIFAAEALLIPFHRALQGVHRVGTTIFIALFNEDAKRNLAARHGDEFVFHLRKIARHKREEIGRLRERVMPFNEMPPVFRFALVDRVPV